MAGVARPGGMRMAEITARFAAAAVALEDVHGVLARGLRAAQVVVWADRVEVRESPDGPPE